MAESTSSTLSLTTESRSVNGFDRIHLRGIGRARIQQTGTESLEIRAPKQLMPRIESTVRNGTLYLGLKRRRFWPFAHRLTTPSRIEFLVTAKELSALGLSGAGQMDAEELRSEDLRLSISGIGAIATGEVDCQTAKISISGCGRVSADRLTARSLHIQGSGSSKVALADLRADDVQISMSGVGKITAAGSASEVRTHVSGAGFIAVDNLETARLKARISGSGAIKAWVTQHLDAAIGGSGSIQYRGNPQVSSRASGRGRVLRLPPAE